MQQESFDFERNTFNLAAGERRKEDGLARASLPRKQLLEVARGYAVQIARRRGSVTSDDVYAEMLRDGYDPAALGPAAGAVFRGDFIFTGEWRKSQRISNHASDLRVWRLKAEQKRPVGCDAKTDRFEGEETA
jgi:hypothetical protein